MSPIHHHHKKTDWRVMTAIIASIGALVSAATPITLKVLETVEKINMIKYGYKPLVAGVKNDSTNSKNRNPGRR